MDDDNLERESEMNQDVKRLFDYVKNEKKPDIVNDETFKHLESVSLMLGTESLSLNGAQQMVVLPLAFLGLATYAYELGIERGKKMSVMEAFVSAESEEE